MSRSIAACFENRVRPTFFDSVEENTMKKIIALLIPILLFACCLFTHRRVIHAWLNGEPMPKAPKWHCWVKPEKRRD